jgi:hypothetical protein
MPIEDPKPPVKVGELFGVPVYASDGQNLRCLELVKEPRFYNVQMEFSAWADADKHRVLIMTRAHVNLKRPGPAGVYSEPQPMREDEDAADPTPS